MEKMYQIINSFGKILNHFLVIRVLTQKIALFGKDMTVTDEKQIADLMYEYFVNITETLI